MLPLGGHPTVVDAVRVAVEDGHGVGGQLAVQAEGGDLDLPVRLVAALDHPAPELPLGRPVEVGVAAGVTIAGDVDRLHLVDQLGGDGIDPGRRR